MRQNFREKLFTGVLVGLLVCLAMAGGEEPAPIDVAALTGERWYSFCVEGRKVGYVGVLVEIGEHEGRSVLTETAEMHTWARVGKRVLVRRLVTAEMFEADPPYRLIGIENHERWLSRTKRLEAVRDGDEFVITRVEHGRKTTTRVPASRRTLHDMVAVRLLIMAGAQPGDSVTSWTFDAGETFTDQETMTKVVDVVRQQWNGEERVLFLLECAATDLAYTYLDDGTLLETSSSNGTTLRLEDKTTACRRPAVDEIRNLREQIPVAGLGYDVTGESISELTIAVTGLPEGLLADAPTQRVTPQEDGTVLVVLRPGGGPAQAVLTDDVRTRLVQYLESTDEYPIEAPRLQRRARRIVGRRSDPAEQVRAITRWVSRHVEEVDMEDYTSALDVLIHLKGDCTEYTLLFVALCRAAGVPARSVHGLVYTGPGERSFALHAWAQVYVGEWVDVDPTLNQFPADATHLRIDETSADAWRRLIAAIPAMQIKVIEVTKRSTQDRE